METYPVMLNVRGRLAVVVGAGPVARRKARALLEAGATVKLVCAEPPDTDTPDGATVLVEPYRPELLAGAMVVLACTDQRALNARIARDARAAGAVANAVDQPEECDFVSAATANAGRLVIAVGTGGAAPGLAAWRKDHLAEAVPEGLERFVDLLAECRGELAASIDDVERRCRIMRELSSRETFETFRSAGPEAVRRRMAELIEGQAPSR